MSGVADSAVARVLVADYSVITPDSKASAIGAGWHVIPPMLTPDGPALPAHCVLAIIDIPQTHAGEQAAITLTLQDAARDPYIPALPTTIPFPEGTKPQPVRVSQLSVIQKPQIQGQYVPEDVPCRLAISLQVPAGVLILPGATYRWSLDIDGDSHGDWSAPFYVLAPTPGPVLG